MFDQIMMNEALKEAKKAFNLGECPIGAVITQENRILAKTHNLRELQKNPLGHAEILCIKKASERLNTWRLEDCTLYVTLEPCMMCAGAIYQSRIKKLIYAAKDPKAGCVNSQLKLLHGNFLNHKVIVKSGLLEKEAQKLLKDFFKALRKRNKQLKKELGSSSERKKLAKQGEKPLKI